MSGIRVVLNPEQRQRHIEHLLALDGLSEVREDRQIGYGIIALTGLGVNVSPINEEIKTFLGSRQSILAAAMAGSGITLYDPASAPFSPDKDLQSQPNQIFMVDSARVANARHVTLSDVLPTTGGGIELEKARRMGKFLYVFHDCNIRTSRMQPDHAFHLSVENFSGRKNELADLFAFVNEYDPAIGFDEGVPSMLGVHRHTGKIVNLEKEVRQHFPQLSYQYDGKVQILIMVCQNSQVFFESLPMSVNAFDLRRFSKQEGHKLVVLKKGNAVTDCFIVLPNGEELNIRVADKATEPEIFRAAGSQLTRHYVCQDEDATVFDFNVSAGLEFDPIVAKNMGSAPDTVVLSFANQDTLLTVDQASGCRLSEIVAAEKVGARFDRAVEDHGHACVLAL